MRLITSVYEPSGRVSKFDMFRADPMPHFNATPEVWRNEVLGAWNQYSDTPVAFHDVIGTHISVIKEEACIESLQVAVNRALEARGI